LVILFTSFSGSLVSRIPGAVQALNIIVLWNTIYMDAAIQQLRREGYPVLDSDVEKLSPLQCGHINMQGRYSFIVPESVSKGELRAFNEDV
ncbi:transposase, partial [Escherichia coli]